MTGRLVDEDGKPRANVDLSVDERPVGARSMAVGAVDHRARRPFRIEHLVPGVAYAVDLKHEREDARIRLRDFVDHQEVDRKPGEVQDWGDVRAKRTALR